MHWLKRRKSGSRLHRFWCYFAPDVSLEEDLMRGSTINAIAQDDKGALCDPYHGQQDLDDRILRHVSDAFVEDPLRARTPITGSLCRQASPP